MTLAEAISKITELEIKIKNQEAQIKSLQNNDKIRDLIQAGDRMKDHIFVTTPSKEFITNTPMLEVIKQWDEAKRK